MYPLGSGARAYYAEVKERAVAYQYPADGAIATFGRLNVNRVPTVFGIRGVVVGSDCLPRWFYVQLPRRPNGVMGFVRARDVDVGVVWTRIVVDLSERRLTVYRRGRPVLQAVAGVGAPATPTPTGSYYVNQKLMPYDVTGPFGPGALGISAFSPVLIHWVQGGPIAIHGTNAPWSIGRAVSNGCIRVRNDVLMRVWALAPTGTPVVIQG